MSVTVGLTGGIASGKSTASAMFAELGVTVIDYDQLARDVVQPGEPALEQIVERFGADVIAPDGSLDRPALGAIVFADQTARRDLEKITHPAIRHRAQLLAAESDGKVVVHDNPLLVEMGAAASCDHVVVVDVDPELQIERLRHNRGMSRADALARINAQATREQRLQVADFVIDNRGSVAELRRQVESILAELSTRP